MGELGEARKRSVEAEKRKRDDLQKTRNEIETSADTCAICASGSLH